MCSAARASESPRPPVDPCPQARLCPGYPAVAINHHTIIVLATCDSSKRSRASLVNSASADSHPAQWHPSVGNATTSPTPSPSLPTARYCIFISAKPQLSHTPSTHCRVGALPRLLGFSIEHQKSQQNLMCPTLRAFCEGWALLQPTSQRSPFPLSILYFSVNSVAPPPCPLC